MTDTEFGELVLIVGDVFVPERAAYIPKEFQQLLGTDKIRHVFCTGNLTCPENKALLEGIAPSSFHIVSGESDKPDTYPESLVVDIPPFKFGLVNGYQMVPEPTIELQTEWQRRLDCDILIFGSTGTNLATQSDGKLFVNPGSITGAFPGELPSFILMAINGPEVTLYVYELKEDGQLSVSMSSFSKE